MKKILKLMVVVIVMFICIPVFAAEYKQYDLIAANEVATVETEMFSYKDFSYVSQVSGKNYGRFQFQSIVNKTDKKVPVSIDILLFDQEKKNIGFVTYCSDSDYDGEFAQKKLSGGTATKFFINVVNRYFVTDKGPGDVSYFAVLDENPYCHVGGYDKYAGLTIEEIASGKVIYKPDDKTSIAIDPDFLNKINSVSVAIIVGFIVGILAIYVVQGLILNALYKRMFATTTAMSYLPIASYYVAVKLAFGPGIAKIYILLLFLSIPLLLIKVLGILYYILCLVGSIAFFIDIIKLITKKYSFCYMEPYNNGNVAVGGAFQLNQEVRSEPKTEDTVEENKVGTYIQSGEELKDTQETDSVPENTNESKFGFGSNIGNEDAPSLLEEDEDKEPNPSDLESKPENNQKEGESELMDLFK